MTNHNLTETQFLTNLYNNDPLVSNIAALQLLKVAFPHTQTQSMSGWKYLLRLRGVKIPHQKLLPKRGVTK